jgi:hypothetical protein
MLAFDTPAIPPPQQMESRLLHDARAVHDTASLRFRDFETNGEPSWVLATVTPAPRSGSATVPGAYIKADTGELVMPGAAETVVVKAGSWKAEAAARAGQSTGGTYDWTEPLEEKRTLLPEDYYSPFVHGGTMLCRPTSSAPGIEQFGPVHLLFPEWGQYVTAASAFTQRHRALFEADQLGPTAVAELEQLLSQDNALLAVLAFRALSQGGRMTSNLVRELLARAEGHALAIFTYLILVSPGPEAGNPLAQEVDGLVRTSPQAPKIRSVALGAFAAALFRSGDSAILSYSRSLLRAVRQRLDMPGVASDQESYVPLILEKMDVQ